MKIKRTIFIIFSLSLFLFFASITTKAAMQSGMCGDNLIWEADARGVVTISGTGEMWNGNSDGLFAEFGTRIKKVVVKNGVTSISKHAFSDCYSLKEVSLPKSIKTIDDNAFLNCIELEKINIPQNTVCIGKNSLEECRKLKEITIPESVKEIGNSAFSNCNSLVRIRLSEGLETIGSYAFGGASSIESLAIPSSVTTIGKGLFYYNTGIKRITIPGNVGKIPEKMFFHCENLQEVYIEEGITSIGKDAFHMCEQLKKVYIPSSVKQIKDYAFSNCDRLCEIKMLKGLEKIGRMAFWSCNSLEEVVIPASVKTIGSEVFDYCYNLERVYFVGNAPSAWRKAGQYDHTFYDVDAIVYYPKGNSTWNSNAKRDYGGNLKWRAYSFKELSLDKQPTTGYAQLGEKVRTSTKVSGDGIQYQWYYRNKNETRYSKSSVTGQSYSTTMSRGARNRRVYCVITDKYGNQIQTKTVLLRMTTSITKQPKNACVKNGKKAVVTIGVLGDGLKYEWFFKDVKSSKYVKTNTFKGTTYSVSMSAARNGRKIYCVVTDKYGNSVRTNTVTLSIKK